MSDVPPTFGESVVLRVMLIGRTGAGKSTLANYLLGRDDKMAPTSIGLRSCTKKIRVYCGRWRGNGVPLEVIDTPGLLDSDDDPFATLRQIKKAVEQMKDGINAVIYVHALQHVRVDSGVQTMLRVFEQTFPQQQFWDRSAIVFTHWDSLVTEKQLPSVEKCTQELPELLLEIGSRLKVENGSFVFKGMLDTSESLEGLLPHVQKFTKIIPQIKLDDEGMKHKLAAEWAVREAKLIQHQMGLATRIHDRTTSMTKKRAALDKRSDELNYQKNRLAATLNSINTRRNRLNAASLSASAAATERASLDNEQQARQKEQANYQTRADQFKQDSEALRSENRRINSQNDKEKAEYKSAVEAENVKREVEADELFFTLQKAEVEQKQIEVDELRSALRLSFLESEKQRAHEAELANALEESADDEEMQIALTLSLMET